MNEDELREKIKGQCFGGCDCQLCKGQVDKILALLAPIVAERDAYKETLERIISSYNAMNAVDTKIWVRGILATYRGGINESR